jgi:predicted kinase
VVPEFAILAGLPGSGKSTLARQLKTQRGFFVVSSDLIRLALNAGMYPRDDDGAYGTLEPIVWALAERAVVLLLQSGANVAIDATNLTRQRRAYWRDVARSVVPGIPVTIYWCRGNWDSAARWASERGLTVEEYTVIRCKLEAAVELPTADEAEEIRFSGNGDSAQGPA